MVPTRVALVGDFKPEVIAHQGIERSFALADRAKFPSLEAVWVQTSQLLPDAARALGGCRGIWCVPASPYHSMEGALRAIRFAREKGIPFLGTCGGFQHALIEYARNVLGLLDADHAETNPGATLPLIAPLSCSLAGNAREIRVLTNPRFREAYGAAAGSEPYQCGYGFNPELEYLLERGPLEIAARDESGEARAFVLNSHPFFVGTLFQPERRALTGAVHPLVESFFSACLRIQSTLSRRVAVLGHSKVGLELNRPEVLHRCAVDGHIPELGPGCPLEPNRACLD